MKTSLIAAVSTNFVIGKGSSLPWEMPADTRYFRRVTLHHHVIMGRTSFEDILHSTGSPLSDRINLVVSRSSHVPPPLQPHKNSVVIMPSPEAALGHAQEAGETEAFIIGGEQLFRYCLERDLVERMYITWIHGTFQGDTVFPRFDTTTWQQTHREDFPADAENPYPYSFTVWER